jgi:hypothetical protein
MKLLRRKEMYLFLSIPETVTFRQGKIIYFQYLSDYEGARSSVVGWGTMLPYKPEGRWIFQLT